MILAVGVAMATTWTVPEDGALSAVCMQLGPDDIVELTKDQADEVCRTDHGGVTVRSSEPGQQRAMGALHIGDDCVVEDLELVGKADYAALELAGDGCEVRGVTVSNPPQHGVMISDGVHTFEGLTLSGHSSGYAFWVEGSTARRSSVTLTDCTVQNNSWTPLFLGGEGKGVTLTLTDCLAEDNSSLSDGGVVYGTGDSSVLVRGGLYRRNTAERGGVLAIGGDGDGLTIEGASFRENTATTGSVLYSEGGDVSLVRSTLVGNGLSPAVSVALGGPTLSLVDSVFCNNEGAVDADARVLIEGVLFHDNAEPAVAIGLSTGGSVTNASFIDDGLLLDVQDYAVTNTLFDGPGARGDYTGDHNAWTDGPDGLFNVEDPGYWAGFIPGDCDTLPYLRSDSPLLGTGRDDKDIGAFGARLIYTPTKKSGGCAVSCRLPALACALLAMCAVTRRSGGFAR